jgi:putative hydrolase of the HAD superfamily
LRTPALVLDLGGPVLLTPFELVAETESRLGVKLGWTGPFAPEHDPAWREVLAGTFSERGYWAARAEEFGRATGTPADTRSLIAAMYQVDPVILMRPGALALMRDARAAGRAVGVLTNDLRAFHSDAWADALGLDKLVDVVVDGSVEGILKPDPRIYRLIATLLEVDDVVFLDDQPRNLQGAVDVGWTAVPVDVTAPEAAFAQARKLLGIPH